MLSTLPNNIVIFTEKGTLICIGFPYKATNYKFWTDLPAILAFKNLALV